MKKILLILLLILSLNLIVFFVLMPTSPLRKEVLYIAMVGPMSGDSRQNGEEMRNGIQLYIDTINQNGGIDGKKLQLLVYDDRDKRTAIRIASQIAEEGKVILVLGHYGSSNSVVAGTIYKKSGIPAITASATSESVTSENDWYFRVIPGNRFMSHFIANYIKKELKADSVSIIADRDEYGSSLSESFEETAEALGIKIQKKWSFDSEKDIGNKELRNIIGQLRTIRDPGMIFFATHSAEGITILTASRYAGAHYRVIAPDSFSSPSFIKQFNDYKLERRSPGYFSDGIYAVAPFFADIANKAATSFRDDFFSLYKTEPSWIAACYYDAANVAIRAIQMAEIKGDNIRDNRRKVRDALTRFDNPDVAIRGVSGDIYFDNNGNASKGIWMGIYQKQKFLPVFSQYENVHKTTSSSEDSESSPLPDTEPSEKIDEEEKEEKERIIEIDEQKMAKVRVIYTGTEINEVCDIDFKDWAYTIDFYLWFRFKGEFDDTRIKFINAAEPIHLGKPLSEDIQGDMTTRTYRIRAKFKNNADYYPFDYYLYPFEHQVLYINFRHEDFPRTHLVYTPDLPGMPQLRNKTGSGKIKIRDIAGWVVTHLDFYQDIAEIQSGKEKIPYSRISSEIWIKRKNRGFAFINLFPIGVMAIMIYMVYLIPSEHLFVRALIFLITPLTAGILHFIILLKAMPGPLLLIYALYTIYGLSGLAALISVILWFMHRGERTENIALFNHVGKILHIVLASTAFFVIGYIYTIHVLDIIGYFYEITT